VKTSPRTNLKCSLGAPEEHELACLLPGGSPSWLLRSAAASLWLVSGEDALSKAAFVRYGGGVGVTGKMVAQICPLRLSFSVGRWEQQEGAALVGWKSTVWLHLLIPSPASA